MSTNRTVLFKIDDFEVFSDSIYKVIDKIDADGPTGFVRAGVSKLPSDGVSEDFPFRYIKPEGSRNGKWDTGFYAESPCYLSREDGAAVAKQRTENILKPYRKIVGGNAIDHKEDIEMEKSMFSIYAGLTFNTKNPEHVMALYAALLTKNLVPPTSNGDSRYAKAFYTVEDSTKIVEAKHVNNSLIYECSKKFGKLYDQDKPTLTLILNWMELNAPTSVSEETLSSILIEYVKESPDRSKLFLSLVEEAETEKGLSKLTIYDKIVKEFRTGTNVSKAKGMFFYNGEEIGADLKSSAENIAKNPALKNVKINILEK